MPKQARQKAPLKKAPPKKIAPIVQQEVAEVLRTNYMPYAMSVIISRAIPEIDGFKPAHRKLLYTMYQMGLLTGNRTKSANIVGQTMRLNPHGDAAIYDTMVRLSRGNETLLMPFVDSKGNFGKSYSRSMECAAPRYTEAKLDKFCAELFKGIGQDAVDMVDNYDGTMKEPRLLPTSFPNILVSANSGIAVGMASQFCGFNLKEVCETTIAYIQNPKCDLLKTLPGPDFTTGGRMVATEEEVRRVYQSGQGPIRLEGVWNYDTKAHIIEITEIPYSTTIEAIVDKIIDLTRAGKLSGINDVRDESDKKGLKIAIDLKRGVDPNEIMRIVSEQTPFSDSFPCNFNLLLDGRPKVLGIAGILEHWVKWRLETKRRTVTHDCEKKKDKLHLLEGLRKILLNIDKAFKIIRNTESDDDVIPNLIKAFKIDEPQASFVAEIKLRNLNKNYILKRTEDIATLEKEIAALEELLRNEKSLKKTIITDLKTIIKTYPSERKTKIEYGTDAVLRGASAAPAAIHPLWVTISKNGYLSVALSEKEKITFKAGDGEGERFAIDSATQLLAFTNQQQAYKFYPEALNQTFLSQNGYYLPSSLSMQEGEMVVGVVPESAAYLMVAYENGKISNLPLELYQTKGNRKCLKNVCGGASAVIAVVGYNEPAQWFVGFSEKRRLTFRADQIPLAKTRSSNGVKCLTGGLIALEKSEKEPDKTLVRNTLPSAGAAS